MTYGKYLAGAALALSLGLASTAQAGVVLAPVDPVAVDTTYASTSGDFTAQIDFVNHLASDVSLYWINYGGDRVFYTTIGAHTSFLQETFLTHPWLIALAGSGDTTDEGSGTLVTAFASAVTPLAWGSPDHDIANIGDVPEPGAWALMLTGFAGLGVMLRRRRASLATA
jgi:hypothetical protein